MQIRKEEIVKNENTNIYLHAAVITWFRETRDKGDQIQADQSRKRSKQNLCYSKTPSPQKMSICNYL